MGKGRLEAFSDGVIAILITIMVLELKVPHGDSLAALQPLAPVVLGYLLSFVYLGIYWNNHHHMLHTVTHVTTFGKFPIAFGKPSLPTAKPPHLDCITRSQRERLVEYRLERPRQSGQQRQITAL